MFQGVVDTAPDPINITELVTNVIIIAGAVGSLYWGIKRWVKRVAAATEETQHQLDTGNGSTIGKLSTKTHQLAQRANAKADRNHDIIVMVSERLDAHLERGQHHEHSEK